VPHSRLATVADRDRALRTIVRGFTDDPLLRFFFPTDERYASGAPVFFGFLIDLNLEGGEVLIADEGLAAALWTPPGGPGIAEAEIDRRWEETVSPHLRRDEESRMDRFEAASKRVSPEGPHRYLGVLATDPDARGRGLARAVLEPVLARNDTDGVPAHLETCTPGNLPFYERFGFSIHGETTIEGGPHLWELIRPPHTAA
jgi:GNAT superfamily N-acetyltransferase